MSDGRKDAQGNNGPADIHQVVLDVLDSQRMVLPEPKQQDALARLSGDLRGLLGLGGDTISELLQRHPRPFSRGLILFFLREKCQDLLEFEQDLLNDQDRLVAAALFAARSGWMGVPKDLMLVEGMLPAVSHQMAALAHRASGSGLDLGPAPPRVEPLRELLTPEAGGWTRRQETAALELARGMGWQQALRTRISLGKGDYRMQVDGRGLHLLLAGDVKAVTTEIDPSEALELLAKSQVPLKLETKIRALLGA